MIHSDWTLIIGTKWDDKKLIEYAYSFEYFNQFKPNFKNKLNFLLIMNRNSIKFTLSKLAGFSIETQRSVVEKYLKKQAQSL